MGGFSLQPADRPAVNTRRRITIGAPRDDLPPTHHRGWSLAHGKTWIGSTYRHCKCGIQGRRKIRIIIRTYTQYGCRLGACAPSKETWAMIGWGRVGWLCWGGGGVTPPLSSKQGGGGYLLRI